MELYTTEIQLVPRLFKETDFDRKTATNLLRVWEIQTEHLNVFESLGQDPEQFLPGFKL